MASPLTILKNVLNINKNCVHVSGWDQIEEVTKKYGDEFKTESIRVHARPYKRIQNICPVCRKKCRGYDYKYDKESTWRTPDLNGLPVYICYRPRRIQCPEHGILTEYIPWQDGNSRFTADFNNDIAWLSGQISKSAIAIYKNINWRTVGNCIKAAHNRLEPDITNRLHGLTRICVDETSRSKGHVYITVVYDMIRNRVVWIHEGNGLEVFRLFCEALSPEERQEIEIVAGDDAKWIDTCVK